MHTAHSHREVRWKDGEEVITSIQIVVSKYAMVRTWVYPVDRFWKYEPSPETERWCRFFGYGHEEIRPVAFQMADGRLVMHPDILDKLDLAGVSGGAAGGGAWKVTRSTLSGDGRLGSRINHRQGDQQPQIVAILTANLKISASLRPVSVPTTFL